MKNRRFTQTSVNNFIHCGDEYLFLLRDKNKKIDAGRLNSIGGKVEKGENHLDTVIRETEEETGLRIKPNQISLVGVIRLEDGYEDDWIMVFFKTEVKNKTIPHGTKTADGDLLWIHKDKVLTSGYELVDDLNYLWKEIVSGKNFIFASAVLNKKEKIKSIAVNSLKK